MIGESSLTHIDGLGRFRPADARQPGPVSAIAPITDATAKGRGGDEAFVLPDRGRRDRLPEQNQPETGASAAYRRADRLGLPTTLRIDLLEGQGDELQAMATATGFGPDTGRETSTPQAAIVIDFAYRTADTLDAGYAHRGSIFDLTI